MARQKRAAGPTEVAQEERRAKKARLASLSYRLVTVIFYSQTERYEELKAKACRSGCAIIHEDHEGKAFVFEAPPGVENPVAGDQEKRSIEVIVNESKGTVKEHGISADALEEIAEVPEYEPDSDLDLEAALGV